MNLKGGMGGNYGNAQYISLWGRLLHGKEEAGSARFHYIYNTSICCSVSGSGTAATRRASTPGSGGGRGKRPVPLPRRQSTAEAGPTRLKGNIDFVLRGCFGLTKNFRISGAWFQTTQILIFVKLSISTDVLTRIFFYSMRHWFV